MDNEKTNGTDKSDDTAYETVTVRRRKRVSKVPANETNEARFLRVAGRRAGEADRVIRLLADCSNASYYGFTDAQVKTMFNNLRKAVDQTEAKFKAGPEAKAPAPAAFMDLSAVK